jgi:hypothetical protein
MRVFTVEGRTKFAYSKAVVRSFSVRPLSDTTNVGVQKDCDKRGLNQQTPFPPETANNDRLNGRMLFPVVCTAVMKIRLFVHGCNLTAKWHSRVILPASLSSKQNLRKSFHVIQEKFHQ